MRRFDDYVPSLERANVVLDAARRRDIILHDAQGSRHRAGAGAGRGRGPARGSRRPRRMAGHADGHVRRGFLSIPPEVIRATIRVNQKCFVLEAPRRRARPIASSSSRISRRATAARRSSPAMSASSPRGCRTRNSSTRPISRRSSKIVCRSSTTSSFTKSSARRASA